MYGGYLQEARLLSLAYDLEQEIQPRSAVQFLGHVPPEPPDAGLCTMTSTRPAAADLAKMRHLRRHLGTGKLLVR